MNTEGTRKFQPGDEVEVRITGTVQPERPGDAQLTPNALRVRYHEVEPGIFDEVFVRHADAGSVAVKPIGASEAGDKRQELIAGLRALADFYETHPDCPLPKYPEITHCVLADDDTDGCAEVAAIAEQLDVPVKFRDGNADTETRFFGLGFRAYHVAKDRSKAWAEDMKFLKDNGRRAGK